MHERYHQVESFAWRFPKRTHFVPEETPIVLPSVGSKSESSPLEIHQFRLMDLTMRTDDYELMNELVESKEHLADVDTLLLTLESQ
jgi:hypothetical protein